MSNDGTVTSGVVNVSGANLFYKDYRPPSGREDVPTIVFVHGGPGLDHSYLLPQMAELFTTDFRVVFYDQLLSGKSDGNVEQSRIRIASFIDDLEALRSRLELGKIHLLGHSWGGLLSMHYAIRYPENLESLILINSIAPSSELWQQEGAEMGKRYTTQDSLDRARVMASDSFSRQDPAAAAELFRISFRRQFADTTLLDKLTLTLPDSFFVNSSRFQNIGIDLMNYDLRGALGELALPALVLYGDYDPLDLIAGPVLHDAIVGSRRVTIEGAGHFPYIERPEQFRDEVREFVGCVSQPDQCSARRD